jgi:hypothetical protein
MDTTEKQTLPTLALLASAVLHFAALTWLPWPAVKTAAPTPSLDISLHRPSPRSAAATNKEGESRIRVRQNTTLSPTHPRPAKRPPPTGNTPAPGPVLTQQDLRNAIADFNRTAASQAVRQPDRPSPVEKDSKWAKPIEAAQRPPCDSAYSPLGLMAIIPLALDTIRDKGCKW